MSRDSAVEIYFHEGEMIVAPTLQTINHRKSATPISSRVRSLLDHPREFQVTDLIVDLGEVKWISSAGLAELIGLQASARACGVSLRLRSLHQSVRDVLRMTRLERIFAYETANSGAADALVPAKGNVAPAGSIESTPY